MSDLCGSHDPPVEFMEVLSEAVREGVWYPDGDGSDADDGADGGEEDKDEDEDKGSDRPA